MRPTSPWGLLAFIPLLAAGCGSGPTDPTYDELGPVQVTGLRVTLDPPPSSLGECQVNVDVEVYLPQECMAFGRHEHTIEGNTFRFTFYATRAAYCPFPENTKGASGFGICLPGTLDPPVPHMEPGTYTVVVNGVSTSFVIP